MTTITQERRKSAQRALGERRTEDACHIARALKKRGRISLRVHGTSMLPWIQPGDVALIQASGWEHVRCGDVVLFLRENHLFVHRIVEKKGLLEHAQISAKGDAHPTSDGTVEKQEVLGRVVRLYRGGRRINMDAPGQLALGLLLSQLSLRSRFWYPAARAVRRFTQPLRHMLRALRNPHGTIPVRTPLRHKL